MNRPVDEDSSARQQGTRLIVTMTRMSVPANGLMLQGPATGDAHVPIERLLERVLNHLPVLIADTITEVST